MWLAGWKFNLMTCLRARNMILKPVTVKQRCHLHNDPQPDRAAVVAMAVARQAEEWRIGGRGRRTGGLIAVKKKKFAQASWFKRQSFGKQHSGKQSACCLLMVIDHRFEVCFPQGYYGLVSLFTVICNVDCPSRVSKRCRLKAFLPGVWLCGLNVEVNCRTVQSTWRSSHHHTGAAAAALCPLTSV